METKACVTGADLIDSDHQMATSSCQHALLHVSLEQLLYQNICCVSVQDSHGYSV